MDGEIIEINEDRVLLVMETPKAIGSDYDLEIELPQEIFLESFTVKGSISACKVFQNDDGADRYLVEMEIGDMAKVDMKILEAYIEYYDRERKLDDISGDLHALKSAMEVFGNNFKQFMDAAYALTGNDKGNKTIH